MRQTALGLPGTACDGASYTRTHIVTPRGVYQHSGCRTFHSFFFFLSKVATMTLHRPVNPKLKRGVIAYMRVYGGCSHRAQWRTSQPLIKAFTLDRTNCTVRLSRLANSGWCSLTGSRANYRDWIKIDLWGKHKIFIHVKRLNWNKLRHKSGSPWSTTFCREICHQFWWLSVIRQ